MFPTVRRISQSTFSSEEGNKCKKSSCKSELLERSYNHSKTIQSFLGVTVDNRVMHQQVFYMISEFFVKEIVNLVYDFMAGNRRLRPEKFRGNILFIISLIKGDLPGLSIWSLLLSLRCKKNLDKMWICSSAGFLPACAFSLLLFSVLSQYPHGLFNTMYSPLMGKLHYSSYC